MSGSFDFHGLLIVLGDLSLVGGGSVKHIYGSLMVGQSINAIEDDPEVTVTGTADVFYSSPVLDQVQTYVSGGATYDSIMYNER